MTNERLDTIAEKADMIINGYAFTVSEDGFIHILNLNSPDCAMVISKEGEMLETNMDEIEQTIVLDYYRRNVHFLEAEYA